MIPTTLDPALGDHKTETLLDCIGGRGMSSTDQVTRAIGHAYEYESDGMGAAASVVELTESERLAYLLAGWADSWHWTERERELLGRMTQMPTYVYGQDGWTVGHFAYVRSDDRGFWDAIIVETREEAEAMFAMWVEQNVSNEDEDEDEDEDEEI